MKKIILILLLTAVGVSAQTYSFKKNQSDGKYSQFKSAGGDTTGILVYQVNPISGGSSGDLYVKQLSSTNLYTKIGTSVAALDSATFGFTSSHIGINNDEAGGVVDSTTLYISTSNAFGAAVTYKLYAGESLPLDFATTKLYFKFGSTAKASKAYRFIVN